MPQRILLRVSISITLMLAIGSAVTLHLASEKMLRPSRRPIEKRLTDIIDTPRDHGIEIAPFTVNTADGISISAMRVSPTSQLGKATKGRRLRAHLPNELLRPWGESRGTIYLLHGRGSRMEFMLPIVERFAAAGFDCICYTARAHGNSGGKYTTYGKREAHDLRTVIAASDRLYPPSENRFIWGLSLGGAVTLLALPDLESIRGAIIVSTFDDLREQGRYSISKTPLPRALTGVAVNSLALIAQKKAGFSPEDIQPARSATRLQIPTMIVHGELDTVIPIERGRRNFDAIPDTTPKVWRPVPDGHHGNVLARGGDQLYTEMVEFFLRLSV